MSSPFSTITSNVNLLLIDTKVITKNNPYVAYVSSVNIPGRIATIRDATGYLSTPNSIVVSTTKNVLFGDGTSSFSITQPFGYITLSARDPSTWNIINTFAFPNPQGVANVSSLYVNGSITTNGILTSYVSSININTNSISTINLEASTISTNTLYANISYINLLSSANIYVNGLSSVNISASNISTNYLNANNISTLNLTALTLSTSIINTNITNTNSLNTNNLNANNISTNVITTSNISTNNLNANNISTNFILTPNISTINLNTNLFSTNSAFINFLKVNNISTNILQVNSILNISTNFISANAIFTPILTSINTNTSSIQTSSLVLNTASKNGYLTLSSDGTTLLFNNKPSGSWSAISTATTNLNMSSFSISNISSLNTSSISTALIFTSFTATASNLSSINLNTSNIITQALNTNIISTLNTGSIIVKNNLNMSNNNISNISTLNTNTILTNNSGKVKFGNTVDMSNNNISNLNTIFINDQNNVDNWQLAYNTYLNYRYKGSGSYKAVASDWSQFPAQVNIDMQNNNISNIQNLYFNDTQIGGNTSVFDLSNNIFNMTRGLTLNNNNLTNVANAYINTISNTIGSIGIQTTIDISNNYIKNIIPSYSNYTSVPDLITAGPQTFTDAVLDIIFTTGATKITTANENNTLIMPAYNNQKSWKINYSFYGMLTNSNSTYIYFTLSNITEGYEMPLNIFNSNRPIIVPLVSFSNLVSFSYNDVVRFPNNNTVNGSNLINVCLNMYVKTRSLSNNFINTNVTSNWLIPTTNPVNDKYVAIGYGYNTWLAGSINGVILSSTDNGNNWNSNTTLPNQINSIAYGNGIWVITLNTCNIVYSTNNGMTFNNCTVPTFANNGNYVTYGIPNNTPTWVAVGNDAGGSNTILYSHDAINFTPISSGPTFANQGINVHYANNIFIAVGTDNGTDPKILKSADGANWSNVTATLTNGSLISGVTYGNGIWYAGGSNYIYRSSDNGNNWTNTGAIYFVGGSYIASITAGDTLVAVGLNGSNNIFTSSDQGVTWVPVTGNKFSTEGRQINYANGTYIAVGTSNILRAATTNTLTYSLEPTGIQAPV